MIRLFEKALEATTYRFPEEWDSPVVARIDGHCLSFIFTGGNVLVEDKEDPEPESVVELTGERLCNIIDGTVEFMTVWRELAEPSPTDRTYIKKGNGSKLFTLLDALIKQYKKDPEFTALVNEYKEQLCNTSPVPRTGA